WRGQPAAGRWKICRDALEPSLTAHALSASTAATEARSMELAPGMGSGSAVHLPSSPSLRTVLCAPTAQPCTLSPTVTTEIPTRFGQVPLGQIDSPSTHLPPGAWCTIEPCCP